MGVAEKLNDYDVFKDMPRDPRSVRDQFNKLVTSYQKQKSANEKASEVNPDPPTEMGTILEDIIQLMQPTPLRVSSADSKKEEKKRKGAMACMEMAMATWRKMGSDDRNEESEDAEQEEILVQSCRKREGGERAEIALIHSHI